ncbi:MAG: type IX secretion system membrane protein PorP/SprF [Saprospiraceae bacterium]|nr:type IX secretion system membrane protein PorP/SprF [Saprospiraceae bacterium]
MQKIYLPIICCCLYVTLQAQQEPQYTQFMFNKLAFNPAYAGSFESPTIMAIYRSQWMGLEGAPETQIISYNQRAARNRVGIGGHLARNTIGITRTLTFNIDYAYRVPLRRGYLSAGVQPSIRHLYQDWTDPRLNASQKFDGAIPTEPKSKIVANVGFGVFYTGYKWYAGAAAPRLINNSIDFADYGGNLSREVLHLNAMGGLTFDVAEELVITPQVLLKYVANSPFDADINISALFRNKFYGGLTYRTGGDTNGTGESVDALAGIQATENLFFCLSYDIGLTRLRKYNNGSVEAMVRWWFNPPAPDDTEKVDPGRPWQ